MNVQRIRLRNFRSYESLDLQLPDGATAIVGPNGAGKSTLLVAIEIALFGARGLDSYLRRGGDELLVEVALDHGGESYRVRRGLSGSRSFLDFDVSTPNGWVALTRESQKATQEALEGTLGLTRATFRASAYLAQGDSAALTSARPAERMEILRATIGGLDLYERAHERVKERLRAEELGAAQLSGTASLLEGEVAGLPEAIVREADLAEQYKDIRSQLLLATEGRDEAAHMLSAALGQERELRVLEARREETLARHTALQRDATTAAEAGARLLTEMEKIDGLEEAAAHVEPLEDLLDALRGERAEALFRDHTRTAALHAQAEAKRHRDELHRSADKQRMLAKQTRGEAARDAAAGPDTTRCRECAQLLGTEALRASVLARQEAAADLDRIAAGLEEQASLLTMPEVPEPVEVPAFEPIAETTAKLEEARIASSRLLASRTLIEELRAAAAKAPDHVVRVTAHDDLERANTAYLAASYAVKAIDFSELRAAASRTAAYLQEVQERSDVLGGNLAAARHEVARLHEEERRLRATLDALDAATAEAHLLTVASDMFAPTGIPLLIIEGAIPLIETRAQEVLERLGGATASCRIELRTQRQLKTSDALRDTLDIVIHSPDGGELAYEMWSGGERMRLDLAVRIGLAQLLLTHGAHCEVFAVDEPDGLDVQGRDALVEVIEEMSDKYGFSKVLLISHDDGLRESFAQSITVLRGDDGASAISSAGVAEKAIA